MKSLYDLIFSLSPKQLTLLSLILEFIFIDRLTPNEQNSLGNFFELLGQILETNAAQAQLIQSRKTNIEHIKNINDIKKIKEYLNIDNF